MNKLAIIIPIYKESLPILKQNRDAFATAGYPVYWVLHHSDARTIRLATAISGWFNLVIVPGDSHSKADMINYAVKNIDIDLFALFDIDNIAPQGFIDECIKEIKDDVVCAFGLPITHNTGFFLTNCKRFEEEEWNFIQMVMCQYHCKGYVPIVGSGLICRKDVFLEIGGFSSDTVTEDADMTMALAERDYKVKLIDRCFSGENPTGMIATILQRSRWYKGIIQSLKKHPGLRRRNRMLFMVYVWTLVAPVFTLCMVLKYLFLFLLPGPYSLALLFLFLIHDFEYRHWEFVKHHGELSRKKTYGWIVLAIIELIIPLPAIFEYFFFPKCWHLTKKRGI